MGEDLFQALVEGVALVAVTGSNKTDTFFDVIFFKGLRILIQFDL